MEMFAGDDQDIEITIYDKDGERKDLTACTVEWKMRLKTGVYVTKSTSDGIALLPQNDASTRGKLVVSLVEADTSSITSKTSALSEVHVITGGKGLTRDAGVITIVPRI